MTDLKLLEEMLDAKLSPIIAEIKQIKASQKGEQSAIDILSDNLDQDRRDISEVRTKVVSIEARLYDIQEQASKNTKKMVDKVGEAVSDSAHEVLQNVAKKGKKMMLPTWWPFRRYV